MVLLICMLVFLSALGMSASECDALLELYDLKKLVACCGIYSISVLH